MTLVRKGGKLRNLLILEQWLHMKSTTMDDIRQSIEHLQPKLAPYVETARKNQRAVAAPASFLGAYSHLFYPPPSPSQYSIPSWSTRRTPRTQP
jgi:hypothetical protein